MDLIIRHIAETRIFFFIVCFFVLSDIVTGFIRARYHHEVNSTRLREGLYHKGAEILATLFCWVLELIVVYVNVGVELPALPAVSIYIVVMEIVSVLENIGDMNPDLARLFGRYLGKLKDKQAEMEGGDEDDHNGSESKAD